MTAVNKAYREIKATKNGDEFSYKPTVQGSLSSAKDGKEKGAGHYGEDFNIMQNFSDVPVNGVGAAKEKGAGVGKMELSNLWAMADRREYLEDASKEKGAGY